MLLIRFFAQSHGLFQVFLEILVALLLGLAAILIAVLCRRSPRALAVLLPVPAVLGFFPRPLSWVPAGALLLAACALSLFALRREAKIAQRAPATAVAPDGRPLHWSEAARLGLPTAPRRAPVAHAEHWSPAKWAGVAAGALLAAAVVVPLSLGTITLDSERDGIVAGTVSAPSRSSAGAQPTTPTVPSPTTTVEQPGTAADSPTTTVDAPTTASVAPGDTEEYTWYTDETYGFAIKFPAEWRNTTPTAVGERLHRRLKEAYIESFGAVAFADWTSPTYNGCYLDFIWVEVYDEESVEVPTLAEFRNYMSEKLDYLTADVGGVKRVEPLQDVTISGLRGSRQVWSIVYGGRALFLLECVLVDEGRAYFLQLAAVEDDWPVYKPDFEEILREFTISAPGPLT